MPTIQQVTNKATKSHVDAFDGLLRELKNSNRNLHLIIFLNSSDRRKPCKEDYRPQSIH